MRPDALLTVLFVGAAFAQDPEAIGLEPGDWLGIDGNWSTVKLVVGSPEQSVSVLASTSLSEFWAVGPGGCPGRELSCASSRGGIFTPKNSKGWSPLGLWQLGLNYLGYGGNGQYGFDSVNSWTPFRDARGPKPNPTNALRMPKTLVAAINSTDYWMGLLGLGINEGTFGRKVAQSPLTQAVRTYGLIPSYTYGYTAGASYRNAPVSVVLGGVDASRVIRHQIEFVLSPDNLPRSLVRGIQVELPDGHKTVPKNWTAPTKALSSWDDNFIALIDSTTPYLWLPEAICDRFADTFNLTYNSTFGLYTLSNQQYQDFTAADSQYNFTFTFSSVDNHDNFGKPLEAPGTVNISLPIQAFVGLLQYPFANAIGYGQPSVPYFALKRSTDTSSFILGRSFLQEAYIVTKYDYGIFKIFQSQYNAKRLSKLISIKQPNGSPYPPPSKAPIQDAQDDDLTTGQIVGLSIGAAALSVLCLFSAYFYGRRKNRRVQLEPNSKEGIDSSSISGPDTSTRSAASQLMIRIRRKSRGRRQGSQARILDPPAEAPNSEIYEMPVPQAPVELDASADHEYLSEEGGLGVHDSSLSAYQMAQRRLDLQLQGPVPEYSPPADGVYLPPEKYGYHPVGLHPPPEETIPISPQTSPMGHNSYLRSLPSPISPRSDHGGAGGLPSPASVYIPPSNPTGSLVGQARLASHQASPQSESLLAAHASHSESAQPLSVTIPPVPSRPFQKSPINLTNIECVGELPDSLQLLRQNIMNSYADGSDGRSHASPRVGRASQHSAENLHSFYIDDQDSTQERTPEGGVAMHLSESRAGENLSIPLTISTRDSPTTGPTSPFPRSAASEERMDGTDLVHVPQMAASRYSWEKD